MAWMKCPKCGEWRKAETVATEVGLESPPCWNCEAPGFNTPYDDDDAPGDEKR